MLNKLPTDENLSLRGSYIPSMCSSCHSQVENCLHLFFDCSFALKSWSWLTSILNISFQLTSMDDIWLILDRGWSPQCKVVIKACIINLINTIWYRRNQSRFQEKMIHWKTAINMIIAKVSLSSNNTNKAAARDMLEFTIMKACKVNINPPKAPIIKEVIWSPPPHTWVKINTDGASAKNPIKASAGGIFRNSEGVFLGCFAQFLGSENALFAELSAAMIAIEITYSRGYHNIWLESDSQLVIQAFNSKQVVPWTLKNRWHNFLCRVKNMRYFVSDIYREDNVCADGLVNYGLTLSSVAMFWSNIVPDFIRGEYIKNRLRMPNFRFISF